MDYLEKAKLTCDVGLFQPSIILHIQDNSNLFGKYEELVSFITFTLVKRSAQRLAPGLCLDPDLTPEAALSFPTHFRRSNERHKQ